MDLRIVKRFQDYVALARAKGRTAVGSCTSASIPPVAISSASRPASAAPAASELGWKKRARLCFEAQVLKRVLLTEPYHVDLQP